MYTQYPIIAVLPAPGPLGPLTLEPGTWNRENIHRKCDFLEALEATASAVNARQPDLWHSCMMYDVWSLLLLLLVGSDPYICITSRGVSVFNDPFQKYTPTTRKYRNFSQGIPPYLLYRKQKFGLRGVQYSGYMDYLRGVQYFGSEASATRSAFRGQSFSKVTVMLACPLLKKCRSCARTG